MSGKCKINKWAIDGFALAFQIVFVFVFLTIFFFVYVVKVERGEFEQQMNYVVDTILTENLEKELLSSADNKLSKAEMIAVLSGLIDGVEFQASESSKSGVKDVNAKNSEIRIKGFKNLAIVVGILIVASILLLVIGYCLRIRHQIIEALWVVLFVALTEFTFLQVVAKNYKSADPNKVKRTLGAAITKWIKDNKNI